MSEPAERRSVSEQPIYIVWVLLFVALMWFSQLLIPAGLYVAFNGLPTFENLFSAEIPDYSHATLWKGRFWYSVMKIGPDQLSGKSTLMSVDPLTGVTTETQLQISNPVSNLLAYGDHLWAIAMNSVSLIEGDQVAEYKPMRTLAQPSDPFLYENQVAVIDVDVRGSPTLLVLEKNEWKELGIVSAPFRAETKIVDGKPVLIPTPGRSPASIGTSEFRVLSHAGQMHLLFHDGDFIAYRAGIDFAPASALAPANVFSVPEMSDLNGWEVVTSPPVNTSIDSFRGGLIDGELVVLTIDSDSLAPLKAFRRVDGSWQKTAGRTTAMGMNELIVVTDGEKTYVAEVSFKQSLRFDEVTKTEIRPTGAVLKAAEAPMQQPLEQWGRLSQWAFWPTLLILALGVGWLMTIYRNHNYQFGLTDVELASITRRGIARVIDYFVYVIPIYVLFRLSGVSSQEQFTFDIETFLEDGAEGSLVRFISVAFFALVLGLGLLIVNSVFQGWWGVTLGKWACGIRTVRTTLRPCGFLRAAVRELLILADTLFLITWLPATLLIAFTSCRQRLGDMVADTIVIRKQKPNE
jgi:uncharacterized RDD family membrane protein YckC